MVAILRRLRLLDDPRLARVLKGSASGIAGRAVALLVNIITLPLALHYLGKQEYGIWVTVSTSVVMLSVLDLGIANTLTTLIAEAFAEDDQQKAQLYFSTAFWVTTGVVAIFAPASYIVWRHISWGAFFQLTNPLQIHQASGCVALAGAFFLVSLPLSLGYRVMSGYQQVHIANAFNVGSSVLSLFAIIFAITLRVSLVQMMASYCASMLIGTLCLNLWLLAWQRPWLTPHPANVRSAVMRRLFGQGLLFFLLQVTGLVVFNSDNLVITHYLGPAAVTPYSTAWRLTQYASVLQTLLVPALWPAFTEAWHKQDLIWVRKTYRFMRRWVAIAVASAALVIGLAGRFIILHWAGEAAVPEKSVLWLMAGFAFVSANTSTQALLLTATGRLRLETAAAVAAAIVNLLLSIYLVQRIGPQGVVLATLLSFLVFMALPQEIAVRRVLASPASNAKA